MIPLNLYKKIIEVLPVLCVDIVISNPRGEYLLIKRAEQPLKGQWWVVGGRVHKGETMEEAAIRKVREEVSLEVESVSLIGYYEEIFKKNPFGCSSGLQTVSIVFSTSVDDTQTIKLDSQSTAWKYSKTLPANFRMKTFDGKAYQLPFLRLSSRVQ